MEENKSEQPEKKSKDDHILVTPLDNPAYIAENLEFIEMVKDFNSQIAIPSIRYESLHNYISTIIQGIYEQKQRGIPDDQITYKCHVGFVNGKLCGFSLFYLLTNRLPHIQTIDWPYCHSNDIRISYQFCQKVKEYKKKWKARYISFVAVNPHLNRVAKRLFKKSKPCGTYWVAEDIRDALIKS